MFLVTALGWVLAHTRFLSTQALRELNGLVYWIGLPSFLVQRIGATSPDIEAVSGLLTVGALATLLGVVAGTLAARAMSLPGPARGAFIQGVFRGNLAFVGLPIVVYVFAARGGPGAGAEASTLLALGPMVVLYNVLAVIVLRRSGAGNGDNGALRASFYGLATNPILIACVAGLAIAVSGLALPLALQRSLEAIGQMTLPLALLGIGATLYSARLKGNLRWAFVGAAIKVVLLPVVGLILAWWIGLGREHTRIALILLACPTASASYLLTAQLGGDEALASSIILVSTLLALPAMVVVLLVT